MKRKNYIFSLALALLMGTMTMSLTACSSEDNIVNNTQQPAQGEVRTYTVSIPATFSGDEAQTRAVTFDNSGTPPTATGSFETTENIYVYNETKGTLLSGTLHPSDISADKKHCQLAGTLTGTIDASDKLTLVYNMNSFNTEYPNACSFTYVSQEGSEAGIIDGGMATGVSATISSGTLTTADPVKFKMQQAIFRLKFTDGTNPITVKSLLIKPTTGSYIAYYSPFKEDNRYSGDRIGVSPASATSDYLYVAVCINESGAPSELTFTVTDNAGKVYSATKAAPTGGFKNGKYYYSSDAIPLTFQMQLVAPTVTWTSVKDGSVEPDMNNMYIVNGPWGESSSNYGPAEIAISGTSTGYRFYMAQESTIKLNGLTATYESNPFITTSSHLTLDISGANSITCKSSTWAISVSGSVLWLSGSGTLTVTVDNAENYGLYAQNYYEPYHFSNVSTLAAPGYIVTRSDMTNNGDGTYTWTYTVAPALGYLYYSDGTYSSTLIDGKKPIGVIAYLDQPGPDDDEITEKSQGAGHGLVLCLKNAATNVIWSTENNLEFPGKETTSGDNGVKRTTDVSGYTYTSTLAAKTDAETKYPALYIAKNYSELPAPSGTTGWFLPSAQQWVRMQIGVGGLNLSDVLEGYYTYYDSGETCFQHFNSALSKAGDGNFNPLQPYEWYWTSSENDKSTAIELQLGEDDSRTDKGFYWTGDDKADPIDKVYSRVRTVLAF